MGARAEANGEHQAKAKKEWGTSPSGVHVCGLRAVGRWWESASSGSHS
jgi:hypothetical protein